MLADMAIAEQVCQLGAAEREALVGWRQPIVLAARREGGGPSPDLAPGQGELGIFLPYTPLHHLLFAAGAFRALVMTSGNWSDEPMATENAEAAARLGGIADAFLVHDREIVQGCDDSVVRPIGGDLRPVRRSRGWAPAPVRLGREVPAVLAVGGELKNTVCLARGREAFLSQHIGSVDNLAAETFFAGTIRHLRRILEIEPEVVAHDLHPDYRSTRWALAQTHWRAVAVQHHHAHIAACMAENGLEGEVIGLALDGTGYGADGAIWGGEALVASYAGFRRVGQIEYLPLPGGAAAIREPWRMGLAWLLHAFGPGWQRLDVPFVRGLEPEKARVVARMIARKIHCPQTSSCGRLFDAVAALTGVCQRVSYEAQAAMELETLASRAAAGSGAPRAGPGYPMALERHDGRWQMGITPLVRAVVADLQKGTEAGAVAWRFHAGLAESWIAMAEAVRRDTGLGRVCLSGGSCNNRLLAERMETGLQERGFEVFVHRQVPPGDGGLCLGQALVAAAQARTGQ